MAYWNRLFEHNLKMKFWKNKRYFQSYNISLDRLKWPSLMIYYVLKLNYIKKAEIEVIKDTFKKVYLWCL